MARDKIQLTEPVLDVTQTVGTVALDPQSITVANGIELENAFEAKDDSVFLLVTNSGAADGTVTLKAGDSYPNKMRGDYSITVEDGTTGCFLIHDLSRFERKNGSVYIDFSTGFTGTICAIGKHAGIRTIGA